MGRYAAEMTPEQEEREAAAERAVARRPRLLSLLLLAVAVVVIDQLSKQWALGAVSETEKTPLIGDIITLQLTFNPGAAFGMASGSTWMFTIITVVVVVAILRLSRSIRSWWWVAALGLLLGGAIGNLLDRLFRDPGFPEGHVVDFINYADQFIGNIADIAIVVAAAAIGVLALLGIDIDGTRAGAVVETETGADASDAPDAEDEPASTLETDALDGHTVADVEHEAEGISGGEESRSDG